MGEAINLVENFKVEKVKFNCGEFNYLENEIIKVLHKKKIPYYSCIKKLNIADNKLYFLYIKICGKISDIGDVMIIKGTSCYENAKSGNLVSITGDGGNAWGFFGNNYKKMAPRLYLWEYYENNPDGLSEEELIDWYIKEFYELRLKNLNPYDLLDTLNQRFGDEIILLCHELPGTKINKEHFCHRRLLADWIKLETGIIIPEISIDKNEIIKQEEVYDLKTKIKKLMKNQ